MKYPNITLIASIVVFRRSITYRSALQDAIQLVNAYSNCRQFTRIDCKGMLIFTETQQYGFLVDRNGVPMKYIGGGPETGKGKLLDLNVS